MILFAALDSDLFALVFARLTVVGADHLNEINFFFPPPSQAGHMVGTPQAT